MSWLFGCFGNTEQKKLTSPEIPLYSFKDANLILFAGGNEQTCFFKLDSMNSCVAVCGVGLNSVDNGYKVLDENEWFDQIILNPVTLKSINGHFVALKYSGDELKFFMDELGLRDIYLVKLGNCFGFTTRIDWLKYFIKPEIDLKEFGSSWLLQNQISIKCIIKNVIRLVCANATIRSDSLLVEQNSWHPDFDAISDLNAFDIALKKLLSIRSKKMSLSLSGGLDSRLLLSYLAKKKSDLWDTHTFGDLGHPDSKIASQLLKSLNRENEIIDGKLPMRDNLIEAIKNYSIQTAVTNPSSSILNLRFYNRLSDKNRIIIDGGFGEIWRREFANRLLLIGRDALLKKDAKAVSAFLRFNRADIFSEETLLEFEKGVVEQLDNLFQELPGVNEISPENWIDIFSVHSRLTNFYAPEQARVDNFVVSFMPLAQKDILKLLFKLNESEKKNGKLFKELIKQNAIQLTKQSLVKGNIIHSFNSTSIGARIHSGIKNKLGLAYQSKLQTEYLNSLREFIGDIIQSSEVRNYELYDYKKLEKILSNFLSNENNYDSQVDWFLSFELFRRGISK